LPDAFLDNNLKLVIDLAARYRVLAIYGGGGASAMAGRRLRPKRLACRPFQTSMDVSQNGPHELHHDLLLLKLLNLLLLYLLRLGKLCLVCTNSIFVAQVCCSFV
jgi:hypothetical protein